MRGALAVGCLTTLLSLLGGCLDEPRVCTLEAFNGFDVTVASPFPPDLTVSVWHKSQTGTYTLPYLENPDINVFDLCVLELEPTEVHCFWGNVGPGTFDAEGTSIVPVHLDLYAWSDPCGKPYTEWRQVELEPVP